MGRLIGDNDKNISMTKIVSTTKLEANMIPLVRESSSNPL